ncbi:MAG TPA: OmpA family protein [Phycisphaerae bacterium]|nr:OmpA family protein [Phycisphaerae bacterium]HNU45431.1 OmpA family protein [Phycisphaerae bacterium]
MRGGRTVLKIMVGGCMLLMVSGCVSLGRYRELQAANRLVIAEKEQLAADLYDARTVADTLRAKIEGQTGELMSKEELLASLRRELGLLGDSLNRAAAEHAMLAGRPGLDDLTIVGAKLPEPLDTALKQFAAQHPTEVIYDAASGSVKWKGDVLFALGSDVVKDTAKGGLVQFAGILKSAAAEGFEVVIVGHTDNVRIAKPDTRARHPSNWHLSAHRAISVSEILLGAGCNADRVGVMGCGEYRPVADNASEDGKSRNRRVEIYLVPRGAIVPARHAGIWQVEGTALAFARVAP